MNVPFVGRVVGHHPTYNAPDQRGQGVCRASPRRAAGAMRSEDDARGRRPSATDPTSKEVTPLAGVVGVEPPALGASGSRPGTRLTDSGRASAVGVVGEPHDGDVAGADDGAPEGEQEVALVQRRLHRPAADPDARRGRGSGGTSHARDCGTAHVASRRRPAGLRARMTSAAHLPPMPSHTRDSARRLRLRRTRHRLTPGSPVMSASSSYPSFDFEGPVFRAHEGGKLGVHATQPLRDRDDLSLLYTPGVADVCRAIAADPSLSARYTARRNTVAVITDGTAVLGLGDIGPLAAMPVMEGKAILFKHFAGIDAVPVCMETGTRRRARRGDRPAGAVLRRHQPRGHLGAALLRHRGPAQGAPRHPGLPRRPARHRDRRARRAAQRRHGRRADAARPAGRRRRRRRRRGRGHRAPPACRGARRRRVRLARASSRRRAPTSPGTSTGSRRPPTPVASRARSPRPSSTPTSTSGSPGGRCPRRTSPGWRRGSIIFALANPDPEVHPDVAHRHAAVVATGRSDFPNQINNVLAFPGIFRGALDSGASQITEAMKLAAASAIAATGARVPRPRRSCPASSRPVSPTRSRRRWPAGLRAQPRTASAIPRMPSAPIPQQPPR